MELAKTSAIIALILSWLVVLTVSFYQCLQWSLEKRYVAAIALCVVTIIWVSVALATLYLYSRTSKRSDVSLFHAGRCDVLRDIRIQVPGPVVNCVCVFCGDVGSRDHTRECLWRQSKELQRQEERGMRTA